MRIYAPSYYKDFKCIGSKCKHNCCIGWEIDIDSEAMRKYESSEGVFKKRFQECIDRNSDTPHFILDKEGRCPFLNKDNLCDIILEYGDGHLCEICNAHPRFRNFYSNKEEMGIGLCCEEAARIIISQNEGLSFTYVKSKERGIRPTKEERRTVAFKKRLLRRIDGCRSADEILEYFKSRGGRDLRQIRASRCLDLLLNLEIMDKEWEALLSSVEKDSFSFSALGYEREFKNLLLYFLYRHITFEQYDKTLDTVVDFCTFSALFTVSLCSYFAKDKIGVIDICRLYSAEIEYSTENTEAVMDAIERGAL